MKTFINSFIAEFETESGKIITKDLESDNLEDATIEATNISEKEGYELLNVDYKNKLC